MGGKRKNFPRNSKKGCQKTKRTVIPVRRHGKTSASRASSTSFQGCAVGTPPARVIAAETFRETYRGPLLFFGLTKGRRRWTDRWKDELSAESNGTELKAFPRFASPPPIHCPPPPRAEFKPLPTGRRFP